MKRLLIALMALWPAVLSAQPAPLVGSTVRTTDVSASSVRVGCPQTGPCTGGVVAGPVDVASVTSAGFIGIANSVPSSTAFRLYNNSGTLTWNGIALATGASLSGTTNTIPVFTAANSVGNSIMTQVLAGTRIQVTGELSVTGALFGTLGTAVQPNVTTMDGLSSAPNLSTVGNIGSGTWGGSVIGLAFGGTGQDLSGTGGTSQFLRQNSVGGAITVVRPSVSDLSDSANVPLLDTSNTFSRATATSNELNVTNTTSGAGAFAVVTVTAGTGSGTLSTYSQGFSTTGGAIASGTRLANLTGGGLALVTGASGGAIGLYTNGNTSLRWSVTQGGDWTVGTSSHIVDSVATPTITSGFGTGSTITGSVYAFRITAGTGSPTSGVIAFNTTFATAPVCVANVSNNSRVANPQTTTTTIDIDFSTALASNEKVHVLCRGF